MQLMQISIHSDALARNFSAAAVSYEQWAGLQLGIAGCLAKLLPQKGRVNSILDVGCGTGYLTGLLHDNYTEACILGIDVAPEMVNVCRRRWAGSLRLSFQVADAERFDCRHPFDLVASSFCFQWFCAREGSIRRLAGMLNPGGMFACAMPVAGSLAELNETYRSVICEKMPGLEYAHAETYVDVLAGAGLRLIYFRQETVRGLYKSGLHALRSFKGTGATFNHHRGYMPRSAAEVKKIARRYERCHALADGQVPLTYNVLYVIAECVR
jgi:malonyl-CoA O-methyltransferase